MITTRFQRIRLAFATAFVLTLLASPSAHADYYGMVEDGWEPFIREAIGKIADADFDGGLLMFEEYIKVFPDSPSGYFYYAAAMQEKIQKFNDFSDLKTFYEYAHKCQRLSRARKRRNPRDAAARVFLGAVDGYIGLLEARRRHLLRAFKNGVETKVHLERAMAQNPELPDTYFGLGMIYYFSSRKGVEEGGVIAWLIRKFITHGRDMRKEGIDMLVHAAESDALSKEYARSALMWIYLYEREYDKATNLAYDISNRFQRDTMSSWVLGRVALIENRCDDAQFWFGRIVSINAILGLDMDRFEDVRMALKKARLCDEMRHSDYNRARALNSEVLDWLDNNPRITLEYQDEKNLIRDWREEGEWMRKKIKLLIRRHNSLR